jgi:hypothetical protein
MLYVVRRMCYVARCMRYAARCMRARTGVLGRPLGGSRAEPDAFQLPVRDRSLPAAASSHPVAPSGTREYPKPHGGYPTRHGWLSHAAWYPIRHGIRNSMASRHGMVSIPLDMVIDACVRLVFLRALPLSFAHLRPPSHCSASVSTTQYRWALSAAPPLGTAASRAARRRPAACWIRLVDSFICCLRPMQVRGLRRLPLSDREVLSRLPRAPTSAQGPRPPPTCSTRPTTRRRYGAPSDRTVRGWRLLRLLVSHFVEVRPDRSNQAAARARGCAGEGLSHRLPVGSACSASALLPHGMAWHRSGVWARRCRSTHCCRSSASGAPRTRASTCAKRACYARARARTRTSTLLGAVRVQIDLHPSEEAADCSTTSLPPKADPTSALPAQVPPAHIGAGTALTPATSAPGLGSPLPTSAPGLRSRLPHLHRDWPQALADLKRKMSRKTPSGVKALELEEQDFSERVRQQTKARDWPRVPPEYYRTPRVPLGHPRMFREYPRVPRSTAGPIWQGNPRIRLSWFLLGRARSCGP